MGASRTQGRPPTQQPPARGRLTEAQIAALISAGLLAGTLSSPALVLLLLPLIPRGVPGVDADVIANYVAELILSRPIAPPRTEPDPNPEPILTKTRGLMAKRRGQYAVEALKRLAGADDLTQAIPVEAGYFQSHLEANRSRKEAARQTVRAEAEHGELLGWYAVMDERTTAECREAHGKNFKADEIPKIGLPGSVHKKCRCEWGPPHASRESGEGGE